MLFARVHVREPGGVVDSRGRLLCLDCWGDVPLNKDGAVWCQTRDLGDAPECERCHRPIADCSPLEYDATSTVEHVACKIF